jgi:hypothetical protein
MEFIYRPLSRHFLREPLVLKQFLELLESLSEGFLSGTVLLSKEFWDLGHLTKVLPGLHFTSKAKDEFTGKLRPTNRIKKILKFLRIPLLYRLYAY